MVDRDVVLAKVASIDRCLSRIAEVRQDRGLRPVDVDDLVALNLQRAVQAAIDSLPGQWLLTLIFRRPSAPLRWVA